MGSLPAVVGVDMGGTKVLAAAYQLGASPRRLAEHRIHTPEGSDAIVDAVGDLVSGLRDELGGDASIVAVGVGAPGLVDRSGVLAFAPNLPGVVDLPLATRLEEALSCPVVVENDATCAAWAEHQHGAACADDAIVLTLGTGIGAGIVAGGSLQPGRSGFAGEAGHMVVDRDGPPCPCGRQGCWERFASGSGLGRLGRDAAQAGRLPRVVALAGGDPEAVRGEHVVAAAREGDGEALSVVGELCRWLALGIANLANLLDPEVVVIGGGLVAAADLLLEPTRQSYQEMVFAAEHRPPLRIEAATVGEEAGALGAALLAQPAASSLPTEAPR